MPLETGVQKMSAKPLFVNGFGELFFSPPEKELAGTEKSKKAKNACKPRPYA